MLKNILQRLAGHKRPNAEQERDWAIGEASSIANITRLQLMRRGLNSYPDWKPRQELVIGYICGAAQQVCQKANFRGEVPVSFTAIADLTRPQLKHEECYSLLFQTVGEKTDVYRRAFEVGKADAEFDFKGTNLGLAKLLA